MYRKYFLLLFAFVLLIGGMPSRAATAFGIAQANPPTIPQKNPQPENQFLIPLEFPALDELDLPAGLSPKSAARFARSLTAQAASPLLGKLERLQREGLITHFKVRPDLHAIAVETDAPEAVLRALGPVTFLAGSPENPPTCVTNGATALAEQVLGQSRMLEMKATHTPDKPAATNPSIRAYVRPGDLYTYLYGYTSASTTVSMYILRRGNVIASKTMTSYSDGYYYFRPTYRSCPNDRYDWMLKPGDVIEVSADGNTVSTVVAPLIAGVDPAADQVAGKTDPGRSLQISLWVPENTSCYGDYYTLTGGTDADGSFSFSYSGVVDFNSRSGAYVYSKDANENYTFFWAPAYYIEVTLGIDHVSGTVRPNANYSASLERGGGEIASASGFSGPDGSYEFWFGELIQPGDVISVSGASFNLSYMAASLEDLYLNPTTNQFTGATGANRYVVAWFDYGSDYWVVSNCRDTDMSECSGTQANGSGSFTINSPYDVERGDGVDFEIYDSSGNGQYTNKIYAPVIIAEIPYYIQGAWRNGQTDTVTVTHKDSLGNVKWSDSMVYVDSYDGWFGTYSDEMIVPGDKIEVTDGIDTESVTVSNLSGRLSSGLGTLSGTAGNGNLVARLWDTVPPYGWTDYYCSSITVNAGVYDLTFSGATIGGWDWATVWNAGPDGHYTSFDRYAFSVMAQKDSSYMVGFSETPGATVDISLVRDASTIATANLVTDDWGYFEASLAPASISEADQLIVQTGDGNSVSIVIPQLTVAINGPANTIYGQAPADEGVLTWAIRQPARYSWRYYGRGVPTDGGGNYSASYAGYWWGWYGNGCVQVDMGHPCVWAETDYYRPDGHALAVIMAKPPAALADAYEPDNSAAQASIITTRQSHTFHTTGEADWAKFTVASVDVTNGTVFHLFTTNTGFGMDTILELYDIDGTTLLASNDDFGRSLDSHIFRKFSSPGDYYLRARPISDSKTSYCDATYDLLINTRLIYLPLTKTTH